MKTYQFKKHLWFAIILCCLWLSKGLSQHIQKIDAEINAAKHTIEIKHELVYINDSKDDLDVLYFNDWNHSYSSNTTPLAERFGQDFNRSLHLSKEKEKSRTSIVSIVDENYSGLNYDRSPNQDILKVGLGRTLKANDSVRLFLTYTLQLPSSKFTKYGYNGNGNYYLKDWYLTPAVYDGKWHLYSNKGLEDLYTKKSTTKLSITYPKKLHLATNFEIEATSKLGYTKRSNLRGANRKDCIIILSTVECFTKHVTESFTVTTDIDIKRYDNISAGISINKVTDFIKNNLGDYPYPNLLVSNIDYEKSPLYGLSQLPSFIRPYDEQFQFEMAFLKTALTSLLDESLFIDPRKERWVIDAITYHLLIKYVEDNYPDQKLLGNLAKVWGIRSYQLGKKNFNDQYYWLQMLSTRSNIEQALTTPNDSLIIFNQKIANRYKAGLGMVYLGDYIGKQRIENSIYDFYEAYKGKDGVSQHDFRNILTQNTPKNIEWFFDEFVSSRKKIDFKIKDIQKTEDSITLTIFNKRHTNVPISLFGLKKDSVVSKYWVSDIDTSKTLTIPRGNIDHLVLNYDKVIPEFNQRDNWKKLGGFFDGNKKLQFRFFRDAEDPYYNQVFYVPIANFNIYDGITPGIRLYNKIFLQREFTYDVAPAYSFLEKTLVGKAGIRYRRFHGKSGHYVTTASLNAGTSHFLENSRFTTITPSLVLGWRPDDLRSNKKQFLLFRYRNVLRNFDENLNATDIDLDLENNKNYSVLNARFTDLDNDIVDFKSKILDFQHSSEFTKVSAELEYRRLFTSGRQLNLRFFGGKFIRNKTESDFFSFALDRPTDYMFDLNYLGRSEATGLISQQIIIAEGGFKSLFEDQFANDWMATTNASMNIWKWVELYGDIGFLADKGSSARFVYGSGLRLNLVTDYFELYFPFYSNKGWEIAQPNYSEAIRFVVTLSPRTLTGLFTRRWF